jgi:hypothetical protein
MNLDDAKELWTSEQDSNTPSMSARSLSDDELLRLVKEKAEAFNRRLWRRDLLESIAAVATFLYQLQKTIMHLKHPADTRIR